MPVLLRARLKVRVNLKPRYPEYGMEAPMNVRREPLTPALSPLGRGEGDGTRFVRLTLTSCRTLLLSRIVLELLLQNGSRKCDQYEKCYISQPFMTPSPRKVSKNTISSRLARREKGAEHQNEGRKTLFHGKYNV